MSEQRIEEEVCGECGRTPLKGHTYDCIKDWPTGTAKPYVSRAKEAEFDEWLEDPVNGENWDKAIAEGRAGPSPTQQKDRP